jgi:hypothetical protein
VLVVGPGIADAGSVEPLPVAGLVACLVALAWGRSSPSTRSGTVTASRWSGGRRCSTRRPRPCCWRSRWRPRTCRSGGPMSSSPRSSGWCWSCRSAPSCCWAEARPRASPASTTSYRGHRRRGLPALRRAGQRAVARGDRGDRSRRRAGGSAAAEAVTRTPRSARVHYTAACHVRCLRGVCEPAFRGHRGTMCRAPRGLRRRRWLRPCAKESWSDIRPARPGHAGAVLTARYGPYHCLGGRGGSRRERPPRAGWTDQGSETTGTARRPTA